MRALLFRLLLPALALVAAGQAIAAAVIDGCPLYPADNIWNRAVDTMPLDANSATYVATIGAGINLHPDFGTVYNGAPNGIPYTTVPGSQPLVGIAFTYAGDSDPGPYPIPPDVPIEGGPSSTGDRHILIVDRDACELYEVWKAQPLAGGGWHGGSGAKWSLASNALRPSTWTSADAAGLPILAGLVRYDEVASGEITHALRFTVPETRNTFVWPARHKASSLTGTQYPPMGQRFRLKSSFDVSGYSASNQVILKALKKYGMMVADNGSAWYLSGAPDPRWDDDDLHALQQLVGSDFEAVDVSGLQVAANSGQARQALLPPPPDANYDIDGNGKYDALTDGLLIVRYLSGVRGDALVAGAVGAGAIRKDAAQITDYLDTLGTALDVDGNSIADPRIDGLLIVRRMTGLDAQPLVAGAIGAGASRTSAAAIATYMDGFLPALP